MSKIELILHPIRMRIIMALARQPLTPGQIATELGDVPLTSLYRHLNALTQADILTVIEERPVRGTVEKVYQLIEGAGRFTAEDLKSLTNDDHLRYFMVFISSLLQDFSRVLENHENSTLAPEDVFYSKVPVRLTEAERDELSQQVRALMMPYINRPENEDRKRYIFALMGIAED